MSNLDWLQSLVGSRVQSTLSDSRRVVGHVACIDGSGNLLILGAQEWIGSQERYVGLVLVPAQHLLKLEVANAHH